MVYGTFYGSTEGGLTSDRIHQTHRGQTLAFRYIVEKGDTLQKIAQKTHRKVEDVFRLNADLFSGSKHPKVYVGQALIIDDPGSLSLPPPPALIDEGWGQMHVAASGDTLESIAEAYNTTTDAIRSDNRQYFPVGERRSLYAGQILRIRQVNTVDHAKVVSADKDKIERYQTHTVVLPMDTLESIAEHYGMTVPELLEANRVQFPVGARLDLHNGMTLIVRQKEKKEQSGTMRNIAEVTLTKQIHQVQPGDTTESIAEQYNMTRDELREFNRAVFPKGYRGTIRPGMQLVVSRTTQTHNLKD